MYMAHAFEAEMPADGRRRHPRFEVLCRARVRIGKRQYAAYVHNISEAGAKLRTVTSIRKIGSVVLRLPDLPPLYCKVSWTDTYHAGLTFERPIGKGALRKWVTSRSSFKQLNCGPEIYAEMDELTDPT